MSSGPPNPTAESATTLANTAQTTADNNTAAIAALAATVAAMPAGPQGIAGPIGPQGVQGDIGPQGIQGIQGDIGLQGIQGIQGDIGLQGIQGIQGDIGLQGVQGIAGIKGDKGDDGDKGDPAEFSDVTKKSTGLTRKVVLSPTKIKGSQYIPIKDDKGNVKAVSVPHNMIIGTSQARSDIHLNGDLIADGNIQLSGEIGKFSDMRLKSNVIDLVGAQDIIENIMPVTFEWNDTGKRETGFTAQNIEEVFPELILKDKNSDFLKLKVTSQAWNALIIGAIKEQHSIINEQQTQIDELKKLVLELTKNNI